MVISTLNIKTPVPCIQGKFGDRLVSYTTQISPKEIVNLLGHDPRSRNWRFLQDDLREIYQFLQRKTSKDRRLSIAGYIDERLGPDNLTIGAFPALSIALKDETEFKPYENVGEGAIGNLMIDLSPSKFRVLIDGLGRITGALDLIDEGHEDLLSTFTFPVTLYAPSPGTRPLSWREMGQLFHDFNFRVQPVSRQHAIALDTSDLYISLANQLGQSPVIADNGGVAERAASLGKKSTELVVQTVLVRTIRGATEGRKFQESNRATADTPNLTRKTFNSVLAELEWFFTTFAEGMGDKFTDRDSLHLTSPGWQALGVAFNDMTYRFRLSKDSRLKMINQIAEIDWSRFNDEWIPYLGQAEIDKKTGQPVTDSEGRQRVSITGAGRTNTQKLLDHIRRVTGLDEMIEAERKEKERLAAEHVEQ